MRKVGRRIAPFLTPSRFVLRVFLTLLLVLSTGQVLYVTHQDTQAGATVAEQALAGTALALSASAERALRAGGGRDEMRTILSDRIVAYALITSSEGVVLFHTNPGLIGTRVSESTSWLSGERGAQSIGRRIHLGTGVPAYEFHHQLHGAGDQPETLRLVLHTTPIDDAVTRSRRLGSGVAAVVFLLWAAGFAVDRLAGRLLRVRDEMARRERLTLVGQMTATLSHEIRNALGGVKGYAQWVDEQTTAEDPRKKGLGLILKGTNRIEVLVDGLLRFSRKETFQIEPVSPGPAIAEAVRVAAASWPGEVTIKVEDGTEVLADREKLGRVLVNGIRNAVDAMPGGGTLTIAARPDRKNHVAITISDTGPGVAETDIDQLFTPFFTTKVDGTGLGLAYSKKVVEELNGTITLRNSPLGATLSITLPSTREAVR